PPALPGGGTEPRRRRAGRLARRLVPRAGEQHRAVAARHRRGGKPGARPPALPGLPRPDRAAGWREGRVVSRGRSLQISISGVRGIVGETLTPQLLTAFAGAMGTYVGRGPILVGRDTRRSGEMVRNAVFAGLLSAGAEPVDLGICPVPSIQIRAASAAARGAI